MVRLSWSPIIVCWMPDAGPMPAAPPRWRESWLMVRNTSEWILRARLQSKPRLFEHLDRLNNHVHAVGLIAGAGRGDLGSHLRPGEGCEVAALHRGAVAAGRLTRRPAGWEDRPELRRRASCPISGSSSVTSAIAFTTRRPPPPIGGQPAGAVIPLLGGVALGGEGRDEAGS